MARNFVAASSQRLENTTIPASATPLTIAAWFKPVSATVQYHIAGIYDNATTTNFWALSTDTTGHVTANTNAVVATTSTTFSAATWVHGCAVFNSATDRRAFLNGGGKGTNATSRTPTGPDRVGIGCLDGSSRSSFMDGDVAEVAMWNIALSDAEVLMLSKGVSPLMVRPDALIFYAPLMGNGSPEPEYRGARNLTVTGSAKATSHAPVMSSVSGFGRRFTTASASLIIDVPAGSLTFNGFAPVASNPRVVPVPAGALTANGFAPVIVRPVTVSIPAGALTANAFAPVIALGPLTVPVPAGALTATGFAPPIVTPVVVPVPAGALIMNAFTPVASIGTVVPTPAGALTMIGNVPVIVTPFSVTVPAGSLTATGFAPFNAFGPLTVPVPAGSLTATGYVLEIIGPDNCPKAVTFLEGTAFVRSGGLSGASASSQATLCFNARIPDYESGRVIVRDGTGALLMYINSAGQVVAAVNDGASFFDFNTTAVIFDDFATYHHIGISFDTNFSAGNKLARIMVDGVSVPVTVNTDSGPAFSFPFDTRDLQVGNFDTTQDLGSIWFNTEYFDWDDSGEAEKFYVDFAATPLGATGELPTGVSPLVCFDGDEDAFEPNHGTGGSFTRFGSAVVDALNQPPCVDNRIIIIPTALLTLTGYEPEATADSGDVTIAVPLGQLTADGFAPVIQVSFTVPIPAGALTMTGRVPVASLGPLTVAVPAGSLTMNGFAPSSEIDVLISVPVGNLVMTGLTPIVINSGVADADEDRSRLFVANIGRFLGP